MATICLICGDKGFDVAMDTCRKCQDYSCHRYCRRVQPKNLFDDEPWLCEDCDPDFTNVCNFESSSSPTSEEVSANSEPGKEQIQKSCSGFEKHYIDSLSSSESREKDKNEPKLKKQRRLFLEEEDLEKEKLEASQLCSQPKSTRSLVVESEEPKMSDCDTGLKRKRRLVIQDDEERSLETSGVEPLKCLQQKLICKKSDCNEPPSDLQNDPDKLGCEVPKAREKCDNDEILQKQGAADHSYDVPQSEKKSNKDHKLEEQQRMITSGVSFSGTKSSDVSQKKYQKPKKRKLVLNEDDDDEPIGIKAKTMPQSGSEKEANKTSEPKNFNLIESHDKDQNGSVVAVSDFKHSNISRHRVASITSSPEEKITSPKSPRVSVGARQRSASNFPQEKTIRGSKEPSRRERCYKDKKFGYRSRPLGTYRKNQRPTNRHRRSLDPEADYHLKHSGFIYHTPVWRGVLSICDIESRNIDRFPIAAHLSTLANEKAGEVAHMLPNSLFLDTFSRSQLWPNSFHETGPSFHHIALYFVSDERSYTFERFIDHMFKKDLALIAVFENVELVVFTSYVLPMICQTIESKYFLWGGFRTRMASSLTNRLRCQQLCNDRKV